MSQISFWARSRVLRRIRCVSACRHRNEWTKKPNKYSKRKQKTNRKRTCRQRNAQCATHLIAINSCSNQIRTIDLFRILFFRFIAPKHSPLACCSFSAASDVSIAFCPTLFLRFSRLLFSTLPYLLCSNTLCHTYATRSRHTHARARTRGLACSYAKYAILCEKKKRTKMSLFVYWCWLLVPLPLPQVHKVLALRIAFLSVRLIGSGANK